MHYFCTIIKKNENIVNKKRKTYGANPGSAPRTGAAHAPAASSHTKKAFCTLRTRTAKWLTYALGFLLVYAFFTLVYGDVIERAEQDMYVSSAPESMAYLLSQPLGHLFYASRWVMLLCKWAALGGAFLALVMTITAAAVDYAFCLPRKLRGLGFIVPVAEMAWMVWRGTNLYYKNEPSLVVLVPLTAMVAALVLAGLVALVRRFAKGEKKAVPERLRPWGVLVMVLALVGTGVATRKINENVILTARFQNLAAVQDWETIIEEAQKASRPTRAVAAYYAIALEETDQLLDHIFDIPFDYPKLHLDKFDGNEEYGLFLSDCNYHAGLINSGYRTAMDYVVVAGPRLVSYKRMAVCALANGEIALCRKYLALIRQMPFESDFVERYEALANDPKKISDDAELKHVLSLYPQEDHYEQNYMPPAFLGFNVGLSRGSDQTLVTSATACLYSKDLKAFMVRAQIMKQKGMRFTEAMQQAVAIYALNNPDALKHFTEVGQFVPDQLRSFLLDAKPYIDDREALRRELKETWLGTYFYYYYTENNDPSQTVKSYDTEQKDSKAGVN